MEGYVKLYRKLLENPLFWNNNGYLDVWVYLILNATHADFPVMFNGERIFLKPGQLITGRKKISDETKVDESKVQRILKKLETEQQIKQQTGNKNRLITILNWGIYQSSEQQNEQQLNNGCTTTEQQLNTNKNVKNVKNVNIKPLSCGLEFLEDSFEIKCVNAMVEFLKDIQCEKYPKTDSEKQKWCVHIERMKRIDKLPEGDIWMALQYAIKNSFWQSHIHSTKKFRDKYMTLSIQAKRQGVTARPATNRFHNFDQRNTDYGPMVMEQVNSWMNETEEVKRDGNS